MDQIQNDSEHFALHHLKLCAQAHSQSKCLFPFPAPLSGVELPLCQAAVILALSLKSNPLELNSEGHAYPDEWALVGTSTPQGRYQVTSDLTHLALIG